MAHPSKIRTENPTAEAVCQAYVGDEEYAPQGLRAIAEQTGKSGAWVRDVLVANGIPVRPRGRPKTHA